MRCGLAFLALCMLCVGAFEAAAQAQSSQPTAPLPSVSIALVGDATDAPALEARVVSWFREQGTPTQSSRLSALEPQAILLASHQPGVRIWIVPEPPASVRVFFAVEGRDKQAPRYLIREVPLDSGLDELGLERVAQVVNLSAMALWAGNVQNTRQEVEQKLGIVAPSTPARASPNGPSAAQPSTNEARRTGQASFAIGFEYAARSAGLEGIAHGPGSFFGLAWQRRRLELGARLHAQLLLPREITNSGVGLRLRGATFALGASLARPVSTRVFATAELGSGLDLIEYGTVSLGDASLRPSPPHSELRPLAYANIGARARIGFVDIGVVAQLTAQLLRTHYDVSNGDQRSQLFTPWLLQPGLAVSVGW